MKDWRENISAYVTPGVRKALAKLPGEVVLCATDLSLRADQVAILQAGALTVPLERVLPQEIRLMADAMLGHATHARQEELRQGFVTLAGGFRAGLSGRAVMRDGRLFTLQDIGSIHIRIAREVLGAADALMPHILCDGRPQNVLLLSPPGLGKTTMLRDAARQLSGAGLSVAIVDERSEIAACVRGVPTLDVGERTDVLDGASKAGGVELMLRAMSPDVIITDEIGRPEDAKALSEAARCGVSILASAHGRDLEGALARSVLRDALPVFDRVVALSCRGKIGAIWDAEGRQIDKMDVCGLRGDGMPDAGADQCEIALDAAKGAGGAAARTFAD